MEVLQLLALGHSSRSIGEALSISVHTVSNHRKALCRKLGAHSTAALIAAGLRIRYPIGSRSGAPE